ncbi:MAG TPA: ankyrin repeat domain-containing protein [Vicinamibacterales bacterium]|nr:ankyrin repeat domain-containing protein [Vicinamibacterales bacterium]
MKRQIVGCVAVLLVGATAFMSGATSDVADAVMKGDTAAVRKLLSGKADVNAPQVDGATALHWAVYRDDVELVNLLLGAGANTGAANREGTTPLMMASLYGNPKMIDALIKGGADAKQRGPNGETTVMMAARNGNPDAIKLLVAAGADVNAKEGIRATTALMWAAEQGHAAAVKSLVELGADVSAKSGAAGLPRNYMAPAVNVNAVDVNNRRRAEAAKAGRTYEEQLAFEQATGAGPSDDRAAQAAAFVASGGATAEEAAAALGIPVEQVNAAIAAQSGGGNRGAGGAGQGRGRGGQFGQGGARPQAQPQTDQDADVIIAGLVGGGSGGLTPLVFAARQGDIESAKVLLDAGANVNQVTEYGWSPLLVATNNRNYRLGAMLLERGADPNIANKGGWSPLYLATDNRNIEGGDYPVPKPDMEHLEYLRLLLAKGADPNQRVKENTLSRTIFTMQWFYEPGATPFIRAAQSSDIELLKLLLAHGADPKLETDNGDTALTAAGGIGWVEGVTYETSRKNNLETVKFLLDLGLDPDHQNKEGRTALMGASHKGRNEVIQLLVDRGAKLDIKDRGSRDTANAASSIAGLKFQALDYSEGLVRVGVQSAIPHPESAELIRKLLAERGLPVPPTNRNVESICVVQICYPTTDPQ